MEINCIAMGRRIRLSRKERGMSSEALAEAIGIAVESLWHIENGARKTSLTTLVKIATTLHVSMDYLVGLTESPSSTIIHTAAAESSLSGRQAKLLQEICDSIIPTIKSI